MSEMHKKKGGVSFSKMWFPAFVKECLRDDWGDKLAEMVSDTSRENLFNSYVALSMRRYAARTKRKLFWARCEWARIDITFGEAPHRFLDWEEAWLQGTDGELGVVETKLIYGRESARRGPKSVERVMASQLSVVQEQLISRQDAYGIERLGDALALLFWYSEQPPKLKAAQLGDLKVVCGFEKIGCCDEYKIWPTTEGLKCNLYVGLFVLPQ